MKLLYITSLSGRRINGFMLSAIIAAQKAGLEFVMACNTDMSDKEAYQQDCKRYGIKVVHIDFDRNPLSKKNINAYHQLIQLMNEEKFDVIHCNTPIGGALGRICSLRANITKVIYMAHGFHFWKGCPLHNWLLYYPVEKILSHYTDTIITITKDDYELAKKRFKTHVEYVHGVGVNIDSFSNKQDKDHNIALRKEIGIPENSIVMLSVGELNKNKNHKIVFEAMKLIRHDVFYVICGEGKLHDEYTKIIKEKGLTNQVYLAGFRSDIHEFYQMADLFVFPSLREGVPGAIMEAIASELPVIASDIRGVKDIVQDSSYRFPPQNARRLAELIDIVIEKKDTKKQEQNMLNLEPYFFNNVVDELYKIYKQIM